MAGKKNNLFSEQSEDITPPKRSRNDGNDGRSAGSSENFETPTASGVSNANSDLGQGLNSF